MKQKKRKTAKPKDVFEQINKIDKPLASIIIKKRKEKA